MRKIVSSSKVISKSNLSLIKANTLEFICDDQKYNFISFSCFVVCTSLNISCNVTLIIFL